MAELRISLVGELSVERDGEPVPLPQSKKTRALLAYLVLNRGQHRRDRLCELFWQLPDDPRASLRWSLSKLRGLVNDAEATRLEADREHVAFEPHGARIDLLEIAEALTGGVRSLPVDRLTSLAERLSKECLEGLDLPTQPDFHYFLTNERRKLEAIRIAALRELAARSADSPADAVDWLRQLVEAEPYDSAAHVRLLEALAKAGRRKDAERQKSVSLRVLAESGSLDAVALQRAVHARPASKEGIPRPVKSPSQQQVRFCKAADGVQIAYASVGHGPPLVKTANWLNHLEFDWESPVWHHVFNGLSDGRRLIRYDARGNGLSDWDTDEYSFDALVSDLEAVVDAAELERFPLLGLSQGCAVSVEYAARHPQRVSKLVLIGGYARGWNRLGVDEMVSQNEAMIVLMRMGWGQDNSAFRQLFTSLFMPDAPAENHAWFNELQRMTTSPENAVRLMRACGNVDVRSRLALVKAPTLVLHARHDMRVPFDSGRELAAGIPDARFIGLDSRNHLLPESDPAWPHLLSEVNAFLGE